MEKTNWIKIREKKPPKNEAILVKGGLLVYSSWGKDEEYQLAIVVYKYDSFECKYVYELLHSDYYVLYIENPTHWQPISNIK